MKTTLIILSILIGIVWYSAVGMIAHDWIGGESKKMYKECQVNQSVDFQRAAAREIKSYEIRRCSKYDVGYNDDAADVGAFFWPVAIPVIYGVRHQLGIAIIVPSLALVLVGGVATRRGTRRYLEHRRSRAIEKQRETEQKLHAAEEYLRREAPDFLESISL